MIEGVRTKSLQVIPDERGFLMEILRSDEPLFERFGQVYVTVVKPGVVKGWHYHKVQTDHFVCLQGKALVVLYDARPASKTFGEVNEFEIGFHNPLLIKIPPYVYHGFMSADEREDAMILNVPTDVYRHKQPDEYRADPFSGEIPYQWEARAGR